MMLSNKKTEVDIIEFYKDYSPPISFKRSAERLLRTVPPKYLVGLATVVLTNFSGQ